MVNHVVHCCICLLIEIVLMHMWEDLVVPVGASYNEGWASPFPFWRAIQAPSARASYVLVILMLFQCKSYWMFLQVIRGSPGMLSAEQVWNMKSSVFCRCAQGRLLEGGNTHFLLFSFLGQPATGIVWNAEGVSLWHGGARVFSPSYWQMHVWLEANNISSSPVSSVVSKAS